ncbi:thymidine kinase [Agrobacterium salinitolerans]|nr:thymidine kinase [Agrobacterium salinitolerans]
MAKLHFNYSVMNAGKSAQLLLVRHNYIENGGKVLLFTSAKDDRSGVGKVSSRVGIEAEAYPLTSEENIFNIVEESHAESDVTAVLIDEVQFMTPEQVVQMSDIADYLDIPVMAYGLKNNAFGKLFSPAIEEMLALANEFNLIKTVCHCGSKATMILKYNPDGSIVRNGEVVETGGEGRYISVCRPHWKEGNIGPRARQTVFDAGYGTRVVCQTCESAFPAIFDDPEQAGDCAAKLAGNSIVGYYGSTVADGCEFKFAAGVPTEAKQGVICDACIRNFLGQGKLLRVSSFFDNDPPRSEEADDCVPNDLGPITEKAW